MSGQEFLPSGIRFVLFFLGGFDEPVGSTGQHHFDHPFIDAIGGGQFDGVQHGEASAAAGTEVEQSAAGLEPVHYGMDDGVDPGEGFFDGLRHFAVFLVYPGGDLFYGPLLEVPVW